MSSLAILAKRRRTKSYLSLFACNRRQSSMRRRLALVVLVPFREDDTLARRSQLDHLIQRFRDVAFVDECAPALVVVAKQTFDGRKFNRGQALNVAYAVARERFSSEIDDERTLVVCHDCDMAPRASTAALYFERPSARPGTRVLEASGCRYAADGCFGGVTVYEVESWVATNGYPNGFWGWGGEDHAQFARTVAAGVRVERVPNAAFDDLEQGVETVELKLARLDESNARIRQKEKNELLRLDAKNWRNDGLNALRFSVVSEEVTVSTPALTCVEIEVELLSERPGYAVCHTCERDLPESDYSSNSLRRIKWMRERQRTTMHGKSCAECTKKLPNQVAERRNIEANEANLEERLTCMDCATKFESRNALFKHLAATSCGDED